MKLHFDISEFVKVPGSITESVADKILRYHIWQLNPIRHMLGMPLYVSQNSGYRTVEYEKARGRSGESEHTFKGKGAVDLTCKDMDALRNLLFNYSDYKRIAWYPHKGFIHCDFKDDGSGKRRYYEADKGDNWVFRYELG